MCIFNNTKPRAPLPSIYDAMRRAWVYRPLVTLLALQLVLPGTGTREAFSPFVASAQSAQHPGGRLFPRWDGHPAFRAFEDAMVIDYLAVHGLPASHASYVYRYGRTDLRNEIRAHVMTYLMGLLSKPASQLSSAITNGWSEQMIAGAQASGFYVPDPGKPSAEVNPRLALLANERTIYDVAISERNRWRANACIFYPDPELAEQFGMNIVDPACRKGFYNLAVPSAPSKDYLLAFATKQVYGSLLPSPEATAISVATSSKLVAAAAGLAVGTVASALVAAAISTNIAAIIPFAGAYAGGTIGVLGSAGAALAGPAAVVLMAVLVGALYIVNWVNDDANLTAINGLEAEKATILDTGVAFMSLSANLNKLSMILANASIGDVPSTMPLPAHAAADAIFSISNVTSPAASGKSTTLSYLDSAGQAWTATPVLGSTVGAPSGWFASRKQDGSADSFSPTLDVRDVTLHGKFASRKNLLWMVSKQAPADTDILCKAGSSGVSAEDPARCAAYVASAIHIFGGNNHVLSVGLLPSPYPIFETPSTFNTTVGVPQTFPVRATASEPPSISLVGAAPAGITFTPAANGAGNIAVAASAPARIYTLTLRATNGTATTDQTVSLNVGLAFDFTSPSTAQCFKGIPCSVTVTTNGGPSVTLSSPGASDLFTSDGKGNGTFSLIWDDPFWTFEGTGVAYFRRDPLTVTATPSVGPAKTQTISVSYLPSPAMKYQLSSDGVFRGGVAGTVTFASAGTPAPTAVSGCPGKNPEWLTVSGSAGSFQLSGTPPLSPGMNEKIPVYVQHRFVGPTDSTPVLGCNAPAFDITLNNRVPFQCLVDDFGVTTLVDRCQSAFVESQRGAKRLATNLFVRPTLLSGPSWLQGLNFDTRLGPGKYEVSLVGTPPPGSAGSYDATVDFGDGIAENVHLLVTQPPSGLTTYSPMIEGYNNTIRVPMNCSPKFSTKTVPPMKPVGGATLLPGGTNYNSDWLTITDGSETGFRDGAITLTGIPPASSVGVNIVELNVECRDPQYPQLSVSTPNPIRVSFYVYKLEDVISTVAVTFSANIHNPAMNHWTSTMTIRNVGSSPTPGNVYVFLPPVNALSYVNEAGFAMDNLAYYSSGRNLWPGEAVEVPVTFWNNTGNPWHVLRPRNVLAGNLPTNE